MLTTFNIKQGDRRPYLYAVLGPVEEDEGTGEVTLTPQDLTGATVTFNMRDSAGNVVIEAATVIVDDAEAGAVHYAWQAGDTDVSGSYVGEFQALYGVEAETFPNNAQGFKIVITPEIA